MEENSTPELRLAIGQALRKLRTKHGYSQDTLAWHVPCARSTITRVELGRHNPSWGWIDRILRSLDEDLVRFARLVEKYRGQAMLMILFMRLVLRH